MVEVIYPINILEIYCLLFIRLYCPKNKNILCSGSLSSTLAPGEEEVAVPEEWGVGSVVAVTVTVVVEGEEVEAAVVVAGVEEEAATANLAAVVPGMLA